MQVRGFMVSSTWQSSILSLHWQVYDWIQSRIIYWCWLTSVALTSEKNLPPPEFAVRSYKWKCWNSCLTLETRQLASLFLSLCNLELSSGTTLSLNSGGCTEKWQLLLHYVFVFNLNFLLCFYFVCITRPTALSIILPLTQSFTQKRSKLHSNHPQIKQTVQSVGSW